MIRRIGFVMILILSLLLSGSSWMAQAQSPRAPQDAIGSVFTYQGQLTRSGSPYSGTCDFYFALYDAQSGGNQQGTTQKLSLAVANGIFTAPLNDSGQFGAGAFNGGVRWLAITVQCPGDAAPVNLGRQQVTAVPYALNADRLDGLNAADIPPHGTYVLGEPGDTRLTNGGYQALGTSNVVCNGCDGFSGTWPRTLPKYYLKYTDSSVYGRADYAMVWTGSEMIIWGGTDSSNERNDGMRYNPVTDTWASMAATSLEIRSVIPSVWTGNEMIVWGGQNGNNRWADGARYNPTANTWIAMAAPPASFHARTGHCAVWTGNVMIVYGGYDGTTYLNDAAAYDPVADTWTTITYVPAVSGRERASCMWTGTYMLVWGGRNAPSNPVVGGFRLDPVNKAGAIITTGTLSARLLAASVWTGSEMIIWGGQNGNIYYNDGARYNPVTNTWTAMAGSPLTPGRCRLGAVWTGKEMLTWGGWKSGTAYGDGAAYNLNLSVYRNP